MTHLPQHSHLPPQYWDHNVHYCSRLCNKGAEVKLGSNPCQANCTDYGSRAFTFQKQITGLGVVYSHLILVLGRQKQEDFFELGQPDLHQFQAS